ncbi:CDP-glycerol glycerophosphotransferase family protein [Chloroflexota bacterium]
MKDSIVLVIDHAPGYSKQIQSVIDTLAKDGIVHCLLALKGTEAELDKQNLSYKTPLDYLNEEDYARLEKESVDFVKLLGSREFDGDMNLVKLLEYEGTSLWWVNEGAFWRLITRDLLDYLGSLIRIIDEENPSRIIIVNDDNLLAKATIATGLTKGIPVQTVSPGLAMSFKIKLWPLWRGIKLKTIPGLRLFRDVLRKIIAHLWANVPQSGQNKNKILLSVTMGRAQEAVDLKNGKKYKESLYFGPIITELRQDNTNEILFMYSFPSPFSINVPGEVRWNRVTIRPWEYYLTRGKLRTISEQRKRLKSAWKRLENNPSFKELFLYQDISLWDTLKGELKLRFYSYFPDLIKDIEISKRIIESEKISTVAIADESSFRSKSLLVAAYPEKIPTLVVQTGLMYMNNIFLEHGCAAGELEGIPTKYPLLPSKFGVYGDGSREILREARYPFYDSITVTGQPRYDILARASETFDGDEFRRKLNIAPDKKLVLIASQPTTTFGNLEVFLRNILQSLKNDPQIQLVIKPKPHASDSQEKWHRGLAEEMGVEAIVLPRNSDTNEALYACDVLITFFSTVALEAMILDKPVVTVNLTDQPDPVPYAQSGGALGVYKAENIAPAVKKALNDPETRERLKQGREKYLYQQFYKMDGQATKRVVDLIYKMSEQKEPATYNSGKNEA